MWFKVFAFVVVLSVTTVGNCFNLENRLPIVKYGEPGSYFGYSLAEHEIGEKNGQNNSKWYVFNNQIEENINYIFLFGIYLNI